ncbi:hypothetical protein VIC_004284 [Vibrio coralliilyticus ATCC BAA-450]|nr:hypothetical protein VIC_004284 [Vibrio coralliilyticus ATCC BAA-450]
MIRIGRTHGLMAREVSQIAAIVSLTMVAATVSTMSLEPTPNPCVAAVIGESPQRTSSPH